MKTIACFEQMDESGDGEISLMSLFMSRRKKRKRKSLPQGQDCLRYVFLLMFFLGCVMAMGIAAIEVTKESRVEGGASISSSAKASNIDTPPSSSRRRLGGRVVEASHKTKQRRLAGNSAADAYEQVKTACDGCIEALNLMDRAADGYPEAACNECPVCITSSAVDVFTAYPTTNCPLMDDPDVNVNRKVVDFTRLYFIGTSANLPLSYSPAFLAYKEVGAVAETQSSTGQTGAESCTFTAMSDAITSSTGIVAGQSRFFAAVCASLPT